MEGENASIDTNVPGTAEEAWLSAIERAAIPRLRLRTVGRVVVASPHPDDETLAVGGLLQDLVSLGWRIRLVSVTDGESAYPGTQGLGAIRCAELETALARLGVRERTSVTRLQLPDGSVADHEGVLERHLHELTRGADLLLAPWRLDGHPDHEAVGRIAVRVGHDLEVPVRLFPVWAWHWMHPDTESAQELLASAERWDLSAAGLSAKRSAIGAFASQLGTRYGPPILPSVVVRRFTRPYEVFVR
jgi:LmbE family N-acetylglucosaminyl deacetylase